MASGVAPWARRAVTWSGDGCRNRLRGDAHGDGNGLVIRRELGAAGDQRTVVNALSHTGGRRHVYAVRKCEQETARAILRQAEPAAAILRAGAPYYRAIGDERDIARRSRRNIDVYTANAHGDRDGLGSVDDVGSTIHGHAGGVGAGASADVFSAN